MEADLSMVVAAVRMYAPFATVFEKEDGNVSIALNMKINSSGLLETFDNEVDD